MNDRRQITGSYGTASYGSGGAGNVESFISSGSSYTVVDVPGTLSTEASAINNLGQVVGTYTTVSGVFDHFTYGRPQGFLYDAGGITTINVPGAASTVLNGINDAGEVSGIYTDTAGNRHGFTEAGGVFSDVTGPDGAAFLGNSVNNQGQLIGTFGGSGLRVEQVQGLPDFSSTQARSGGMLMAATPALVTAKAAGADPASARPPRCSAPRRRWRPLPVAQASYGCTAWGRPGVYT